MSADLGTYSTSRQSLPPHHPSNALSVHNSDTTQYRQLCWHGAGSNRPNIFRRACRQLVSWMRKLPVPVVQVKVRRHGELLVQDRATQVDAPIASNWTFRSRSRSRHLPSLSASEVSPPLPPHSPLAQENKNQGRDSDLLRSIWKRPTRALSSPHEEQPTSIHEQIGAITAKPAPPELPHEINGRSTPSRKHASDGSSIRQLRSRPSSPLAQSWSVSSATAATEWQPSRSASTQIPSRPHSAPNPRTRPSLSRRQRTQSSDRTTTGSESSGSPTWRRKSSIRHYFSSKLTESVQAESREDVVPEPTTPPVESAQDFYRVRQDEGTADVDVNLRAEDIPMHLPSSPLCPQNPKHPSGGTGYCPIHGAAANLASISYERLQRDLVRTDHPPKTEALLGVSTPDPSRFEFHVTPHSPDSPLCPANGVVGKRLCVLHGRGRFTSANDPVSAYITSILSAEDEEVD